MKTLFLEQSEFFKTNQTKDINFRIQQLKKFKSLIQDNESLLYDSIMKDFGKSEFETFLTEFSLFYDEMNHAISHLRRWSKVKRVRTGVASFPAKSYIVPEPLGVTLVIGAWNYPYQLSLVPALISIAAGNTVILKPSELPSNTSKTMATLINNAFPSSVFHVVEGGVTETSQLLELPFDKIFFTGSIPVGRIVYQAAAKNLTPVTLELGGKSPTFVFDDCNLALTVQRIAWAKFLNAGQTCVAPDYILVEKSIEEKFLQLLAEEIEKMYPTDGSLSENYTQIINDKNFDRVSKLIDRDKLYCGGVCNSDNRIISPTVLSGVHFDDEVMKDEIFGPVLPVIAFDNLDEVIREVKNRPKPLSCYIYSSCKKRINKILHEISFGGGAVNDSIMHLTNKNLPFGGVGFSGMGSYHGKAGFDSFTHYKSVLHQSNLFEMPLKYKPYGDWKLKLLQRLFRS